MTDVRNTCDNIYIANNNSRDCETVSFYKVIVVQLDIPAAPSHHTRQSQLTNDSKQTHPSSDSLIAQSWWSDFLTFLFYYGVICPLPAQLNTESGKCCGIVVKNWQVDIQFKNRSDLFI